MVSLGFITSWRDLGLPGCTLSGSNFSGVLSSAYAQPLINILTRTESSNALKAVHLSCITGDYAFGIWSQSAVSFIWNVSHSLATSTASTLMEDQAVLAEGCELFCDTNLVHVPTFLWGGRGPSSRSCSCPQALQSEYDISDRNISFDSVLNQVTLRVYGFWWRWATTSCVDNAKELVHLLMYRLVQSLRTVSSPTPSSWLEDSRRSGWQCASLHWIYIYIFPLSGFLIFHSERIE